MIRLRIGILRIERAEIEKLAFVMTVAEDLDCSGLPVSDEEICTYDEDFIAGLLLAYTGREFSVKEVEVNQKVGRRMLERLGCCVELAQNGREALDLLNLRRYDIVFMDCQTPVMDGYTAVAELRRREPNHCRTLVIALTAHAMEGARERRLESGMDDYLTKPFSARDLGAMLEKCRLNRSSHPHLTIQPLIPLDVDDMACRRGREQWDRQPIGASAISPQELTADR